MIKKSPFLINKLLIHAPPDLCLITTDQDGTKKFFVHKIILMCISPYFQKVIQYKNGLADKNSICDCKIEEVKNAHQADESEPNPSIANSNSSTNTINKPSEDSDKQLIQTCRKANKKIEKDCLTLKLPGLNDKILSVIINYAYNGRIQLSNDNVQDLIIASDMYNIPALVNLCTNFLIQSLTIYNSIGIYLFAKEYNLSKLIDRSEKFILRNFERIYETSDEFLQLLNVSELLHLVEQNLLYVVDEYFVFKSIVKWTLSDEELRKPFFGELIQKVRLALITNERLQNQILNHKLVASNRNVQIIVSEVLKLKKYLDTWGKPNFQMLNNSIKKYLTPRYPLGRAIKNFEI